MLHFPSKLQVDGRCMWGSLANRWLASGGSPKIRGRPTWRPASLKPAPRKTIRKSLPQVPEDLLWKQIKDIFVFNTNSCSLAYLYMQEYLLRAINTYISFLFYLLLILDAWVYQWVSPDFAIPSHSLTVPDIPDQGPIFLQLIPLKRLVSH